MLVSLIYFIAFFSKVISNVEFPLDKCCEHQELLIEHNSTYPCTKNEIGSIEIIKNAENELGNACVDIFESKIHVFDVLNGSFSEKMELVVNPVRKCCPLGYIYETERHACKKQETEGMQWNTSKIFKIGMTKCNIIQDYVLETEGEINMDYNKLIIHNRTYDLGDFCLDKTTSEKFVVRVCETLEICEKVRCIHKCCPDNQSFVNGSHCRNTDYYGVNLNFSKCIENPYDDFAIIHGYTGKVYLQPSNWIFSIDEAGVFRHLDEKLGDKTYYPQQETYCIEHASKGGIDYGYRLFRKFPETTNSPIELKYVLNGWAMVFSGVFLVFVIIFYVFSKETRNLFGKTLVSFCVALLVTFVIIVYSTFGHEYIKSNKFICRSIGFTLIFMEFSSFLWLQILCFDIYYTFGSRKMVSAVSERERKNKRFVYYSVYGWGCPVIFTAILLIIYYLDFLPSCFRINMGVYRCSIDRVEGNYAELLFRTVPLTVIQFTNLVLFIKTIAYCMAVKNEIGKMMNTSERRNTKMKYLITKERLTLICKLSIIMGISYLFEVISSFYDFNKNKVMKNIEIIWDMFNCLQGLHIFIIFMCKKKLINRVKRKTGLHKLRKISLSFSNTNTTALTVSATKKNIQNT